MPRFNEEERHLVTVVAQEAKRLVTKYYALSPREWLNMRYQVKTQLESAPTELRDDVLAHVLCYEFTRTIGNEILEKADIYRICLQDNRILITHPQTELQLDELLVHILTHEFVHVVRFAQQRSPLDLPEDERWREEAAVEKITTKILGTSESESRLIYPAKTDL